MKYNIYGLEVMGSNPSCVKLEVRSTSVCSTLTKNKTISTNWHLLSFGWFKACRCHTPAWVNKDVPFLVNI